MKLEKNDMQSMKHKNAVGLANLVVVYTVWSSTYLAIRLTVRQGGGFPPFLMGASRLLVASTILLLWFLVGKSSLKITRRDLLVLGISGIFLWVGGNGMVNWAEQYASSGYAALVVGSAPIFICLMEAFVDRKRPALMLLLSVLTGFIGLVVLVWPALRSGNRTDWMSTIALCVGTISWGAASLYLNRKKISVSSLTASFYQQLFGGSAYLMVGLIAREPVPHPSTEAWLAWGYLIVFGSLLAFTSYIVALRNLPVSIVMTYAYVNPVLAVILGWAALDEKLSWWTAGGTALILLGVAGVFRQKYKTRSQHAKQ
jgi:drug/metabolite transporter (DMT)-like permease